MDKNLPKVTLLIVVRNEGSYIAKSLQSLLEQTYQKELTEIIIVDGMSTDGTKEWFQSTVEELQVKGVDIKLLDNPKYILASGWNIGIKNASGDIVCRIDAHSEIDSNYVVIGVKCLLKRKDENVVCVGGILKNEGIGFLGKAIATLYSSRFGVGNSVFRTGTTHEPKFTDTAVFGLYWKWVFDEVGYFDENLERNQDIALHFNISRKGYKFITYPDMKIKYYVRNTTAELIKKAFGDGYWVIASEKSYLRHKVPLFFILYLFSIPITFWAFKLCSLSILSYFYLFPLFLYLSLSLYFGLKNSGYLNKLLLLLLFPTFHISYGTGSLKAITDKYIWKKLQS